MTALPARDAPVPWMEEEKTAGWADRLRKLASIDEKERIEIGPLLDWLTNFEMPNKGKLQISEVNPDPSRYKAIVTYRPLKLSIEKELLVLGRLGHSKSKYIIAHEIGHMALHNEHARSFTTSPVSQKLFIQKNKSAEWQANTFADHLLVTNNILIKFQSPEQISKQCGVTDDLALRRWAARKNLIKSLCMFEGDPCPKCLNFTLLRNAICINCETCGASTACI